MEQTKTTYKQELKTRIDSLLERAIVIQGQLTYSINTGDFFLAAGYFDELGGVFKAAAKAMREAGRKRNLETEPLEKLLLTIIYNSHDFESERLLDKMKKISFVSGCMVLFVRDPIQIPLNFYDLTIHCRVRTEIYHFRDQVHLNSLVSAFLGTNHWKYSDNGEIVVTGHAARRLNKRFS